MGGFQMITFDYCNWGGEGGSPADHEIKSFVKFALSNSNYSKICQETKSIIHEIFIILTTYQIQTFYATFVASI